MARIGTVLVLLQFVLCSTTLIIIVMPPAMVHGIIAQEGPKPVQDWFHKLGQKKEKVTNLHFYFHDILSGKNPTAVRVAQPNATNPSSPTFFGMVMMVDDPLTVGPQQNSTQVGRAQGLYASAGIKDLSLLMTMNFHFTSGKYNGSTLSILGRNSALEEYREMPIVGGTGVFRLARGIATAKTYWFDATTGDATVEYHVIVLHY